MARSFNGTNEYLTIAGASWHDWAQAATKSVSFWFNTADTQATMIHQQNHCVYLYLDAAGNMESWMSGLEHNFGGPVNDGAWHNFISSYDGTDETGYFDGSQLGAANTVVANADTGAFYIGCAHGPGEYSAADIAEVAWWTVALTAAEAAILGHGYSPLSVRPQSLVAYWPLIRDSDDDRLGPYSLTPTNTPTVAAHPPVIYAPPLYTIKGTTAAAGVTVPVLYYHYAHH